MCLKTVIVIAFCFFVIVKATGVVSSSVHVFKESLEVKYERLLAKLQKNRETLTNALKSVDRKIRSVPNLIAFHSVLNNVYSPMSPHQVIPFEMVIAAVGNGYDKNFGLFQAPVSGYYQFVLTSQAYPSSSYMVNLEMVRNGNMLCRAHAATYGQEGYCVAMVHLNKGDDVWVRHYDGQGTFLYHGKRVPSFSGHLIKAD